MLLTVAAGFLMRYHGKGEAGEGLHAHCRVTL
jgi:hypothetical protein